MISNDHHRIKADARDNKERMAVIGGFIIEQRQSADIHQTRTMRCGDGQRRIDIIHRNAHIAGKQIAGANRDDAQRVAGSRKCARHRAHRAVAADRDHHVGAMLQGFQRAGATILIKLRFDIFNLREMLRLAEFLNMLLALFRLRFRRIDHKRVMHLIDLDGNVVDGSEAPSSDTASHAYIYRHMPDVYGVVHTHSTYATAWAATGQNIPCGLTMMGDEFGGPVPVGPFRLIGSEAIGEGVVETLREYPKSPAVLMQNHGPFTIGKDAESAVKAAAMTEEVAHTMWAARQLGEIIPISDEDIAKLNDRYTNVYGQH